MPFLFSLSSGPVISAIWNILTSRVTLMLVAAVIAYNAGSREAEKRCDTERLQAEIATLKADRDTSAMAQGLAEQQAGDLESHLKANQKRVDDLVAELEHRKTHPEVRVITKTAPGTPNAAPSLRDCGLSADDVRRLKEIQ